MNFSESLIYLITQGNLTTENFSAQSYQTLQIIELATKLNVSLVQIREKHLPVRFVYELTSEAVRIAKHSQTKILVNDRIDIALATKADGVHLTSKSLPIHIVRQNCPVDFIIGVSTHSIKEVLKSKTEGADFAVFSPIFPTPGKEKYGLPQGIDNLAKAVRSAEHFPVVALGGINEANLAEVFQTGAAGIAAIRFLNDASRMPRIVRRIQKKNEER